MTEQPSGAVTEQFPGAVLDILGAADGRTVFEHAGREVSGVRLLGMVRRAVNGLRQYGVGPGDGVVMLLGVGPGASGARPVRGRGGTARQDRARWRIRSAHRTTSARPSRPSSR
ncbi:hypothetical protein GCM10010327_18190 [Streptomyces nitrosporeus]|nr:hypothetical protein GCM10010327_18190 [Streptomyces nitrosporeus]